MGCIWQNPDCGKIYRTKNSGFFVLFLIINLQGEQQQPKEKQANKKTSKILKDTQELHQSFAVYELI